MEKRAPKKCIEVDSKGVGWEVTVTYPSYSNVYDQNTTTERVELPVVVNNYCCPICGHDEFEPIYEVQRGLRIGHCYDGPAIFSPVAVGSSQNRVRVIAGYRCPGCTISMFADPRRFSKNQPASVSPPIATESPETEARLQLAEMLHAMKGNEKR